MRKAINLVFGGVLLTSLLLGTLSFAEEKGKDMMGGKMMCMMEMCPMMQSMRH